MLLYFYLRNLFFNLHFLIFSKKFIKFIKMNKKTKKLIDDDYFNILEYSEYAVIVPVDNNYDTSMFFFAGFNENASKYIYLFKNFLEAAAREIDEEEERKLGNNYDHQDNNSEGIKNKNLNFEKNFNSNPGKNNNNNIDNNTNSKSTPNLKKLKIIIPFLAKYSMDEYPSYWLSHPEKFTHLFAWYSIKVLENQKGVVRYQLIHNENKNKQVIDLINKEIIKLGSSEDIIFCGFSMGGRYLLEILKLMKIKTKFNICFKSVIMAFENPFSNFNSIEAKKFQENNFYLYYSLNDKIVIFNRCAQSVEHLKENNFRNIKVKVDNRRKHVVDEKCLRYLRSIYEGEVKISDSFDNRNINRDNNNDQKMQMRAKF